MKATAPNLLPQSVIQRLQVERARIESGAFSSALGVGEMLLARQSGYRVLGQVMGASVYQFGGQWTRSNWRNQGMARLTQGSFYELTAITTALTSARELALSRLRAEAILLGAIGVVGVYLRLQKPVGAGEKQNQLEITAIGTAVTRETVAAPTRSAPVAASFNLPRFAPVSPVTAAVMEPFTSNLSSEETWKLERAGYVPCGLIMGNCAICYQLSMAAHHKIELAKSSRFGGPLPPRIARPSARRLQARSAVSRWELHVAAMEWQVYDEWKRNPSGNFEVSEYTGAIYDARELAVARLEVEAQKCGASGIVGVQIDVDSNPFLQAHYEASHADQEATFAFMATGTAIRSQRRTENPESSIEAVLDIT